MSPQRRIVHRIELSLVFERDEDDVPASPYFEGNPSDPGALIVAHVMEAIPGVIPTAAGDECASLTSSSALDTWKVKDR